jgi:uncharacterized SAM-binding protein YcdF (DUF218 family)
VFILAFIFRKRTAGKRLLLSGIIALYFFMNSFIADEAIRAWEYSPTQISQSDSAYDAGIVLSGGMVTLDKQNNRLVFLSSTDRFLQAASLYKQKKIKKIFLCGGDASLLHDDESESALLSRYLVQLGIPEKDIITESFSKNTFENAYYANLYCNQLWPKGRFLLITSAYHMPRAVKCFNKYPLNIAPYPTDFHSGVRRFQIQHLLIPHPDNLTTWNILIHEWVGILIYKIKGKI